MKLHNSIQTKETTKLFNKKYKFKIVIVTKTANWFRGNNLAHTKNMLTTPYTFKNNYPTKEDIEFGTKVLTALALMNDYTLRVENPFLNVYTNEVTNIEKLAKINPLKVKYVSLPDSNSESLLTEKTVLVKTLDFDFKVTMGRTHNSFLSFVNWAKDNPSIKLPKKANKELGRDYSFGGYYFYVKGEKALTLVKVFLGSNIQSVDNCIKH
jgi:hypothetical protein